jgi:hypothetical protein
VSDLLDAEAAYADGTLRAQSAGLVKRFIREARPGDIMANVAVPIARLADTLRRMGQTVAGDGILAHAVHDGVPPTVLVQAVAANNTAPALNLGDPIGTVSVGAIGQLYAGAPPPAAPGDLAATAELANYLRDRIVEGTP